jgi:membrane-associated protease RseP (regulator of RpoE activity)
MSSDQKRVLLQLGLFILTFITTTIAGAEWAYGRSIFAPDYSWSDFSSGLEFSIPFLLILTVHEFGHYFVARYHKVKVTLPYYLPMPPLPFSIGTMGALIRIKEKIYSKKQNFDIGIAGPLAGFATALIILFYAFTHLPEPEYIFQIHPEYEQYGLSYADHVYENENIVDITIGKNLLFLFFEKFVADPDRMPNPHEIMHYPLILAGFLSIVFTFLNLLPIGQLDGGHVSYGLFGFKIHRIIASVIFVAFLFYAGIGVVTPRDSPDDLLLWVPGSIGFLYLALSGLGFSKRDTLMYALVMFAALFVLSWLFPNLQGYSGWLFFGFLIGRFIGIQHPPSEIQEPLDTKRIILGWLSLLIFVICFTPAPFMVTQVVVDQP